MYSEDYVGVGGEREIQEREREKGEYNFLTSH